MQADKCKRIIEGKTYNTETATQIEGRTKERFSYRTGEYLYQTRSGAFFKYLFREGQGKLDFQEIGPLEEDAARKWLEQQHGYQAEQIDKLFGEASKTDLSEVKYTLRMPVSLHKRVVRSADVHKQSLNAWILRCLERGANEEDLN